MNTLMNHDEIQMYLLNEKNRSKILKKLRVKLDGRNSWVWQSTAKQEERYKPEYQPELFVDLLETRILPERKKYSIEFFGLCRHERTEQIFEGFQPLGERSVFDEYNDGNVSYHNFNDFKGGWESWVRAAIGGYSWGPSSYIVSDGHVLAYYFFRTYRFNRYFCELFFSKQWRVDVAKGEKYTIVWEIKPELNDLGATLRQLQKYKDTVKPNVIILVYVNSNYSDKRIQEYFNNQKVWTYKLSALAELDSFFMKGEATSA